MKPIVRLSFGLVPAAILFSACAPPKPATPAPPKVTVSQPQSMIVTNWDEYPGHVEAVEMVDVRPRVSGYIDSIHFQDGSEVKAGDLLFVIDPKPYQAELDRAAAQRGEAETRLELAKNDLKRAEGLRGGKAISEEEYDNRSNAVRQADAALAAARAAEAVARLNLDYTRVTAPINGRIGRRLVTRGNFVQLQGSSGASTILATIFSIDPIYCYFDVEEGALLKYRAEAQAGEVAEAKTAGLPCELGLVNEEGFAHRGHLDFFDNQVNPQTGTIRLRAVFENRDRTLLPGMFANVRVLAGPAESALLIPEVAVLSDQGYKYVYLVDGEGKAQTRSVKVGRAHGSWRVVTDGLKTDDRVVVNGLVMLRQGSKVDLQSPAPLADSKH